MRCLSAAKSMDVQVLASLRVAAAQPRLRRCGFSKYGPIFVVAAPCIQGRGARNEAHGGFRPGL